MTGLAVAGLAGALALALGLLGAARREGPPRSPLPALALGLGLAALGVVLALLPEAARPPPPPPPPAPPPPPEPPPRTAVAVHVLRPSEPPPFDDATYRYRGARWLRYADGVVLRLSRGEVPPGCRLDDGAGQLLWFPGWAVDPRTPGEHVVAGVYDTELGSEALPLAGTVRVAEPGGPAALDLSGENLEATGVAVADTLDCEGPSRRAGAGPSAVRYALRDLDGADHAGTLTYAKVLASVRGFTREPADLLVLQSAPSEGCGPRASGLRPGVSGAWLLTGLPAAGEVRAFGPADTMKVWTWTPPQSASHNLPLAGEVRVDTRDAGALTGFLAVTLPGGGSLVGPVVAEVVDCADWRGPYPL